MTMTLIHTAESAVGADAGLFHGPLVETIELGAELWSSLLPGDTLDADLTGDVSTPVIETIEMGQALSSTLLPWGALAFDKPLVLASRVRVVGCPRCRQLARRIDTDRLDDEGLETYWALSCTHCGLAVGDEDELIALARGADAGTSRRELDDVILECADPNRWLSVYSPSDAASVEARQLLTRAQPKAKSQGLGVSVDPRSSTHGLNPQPIGGPVTPTFTWSDPMNHVFNLVQAAAPMSRGGVSQAIGDVPLYLDTGVETRMTFWREFISWLRSATDDELDQLEAVLLHRKPEDLSALKAAVAFSLEMPEFVSQLPKSLVICMQEANWPMRLMS